MNEHDTPQANKSRAEYDQTSAHWYLTVGPDYPADARTWYGPMQQDTAEAIARLLAPHLSPPSTAEGMTEEELRDVAASRDSPFQSREVRKLCLYIDRLSSAHAVAVADNAALLKTIEGLYTYDAAMDKWADAIPPAGTDSPGSTLLARHAEDKRKLSEERDGWHRVVTDCERILECTDTATSPTMSNLPVLVRDLKTERDKLVNEGWYAPDRVKEAEARAKSAEQKLQTLREQITPRKLRLIATTFATLSAPSAARTIRRWGW